jgi:hypothetical protein
MLPFPASVAKGKFQEENEMSDVDPTANLGRTLRLLALVALDGRPQKEQVRLLDKAGFGQAEIAGIVGSTPKAISVRLAELRRSTKGGTR